MPVKRAPRPKVAWSESAMALPPPASGEGLTGPAPAPRAYWAGVLPSAASNAALASRRSISSALSGLGAVLRTDFAGAAAVVFGAVRAAAFGAGLAAEPADTGFDAEAAEAATVAPDGALGAFAAFGAAAGSDHLFAPAGLAGCGSGLAGAGSGAASPSAGPTGAAAATGPSLAARLVSWPTSTLSTAGAISSVFSA